MVASITKNIATKSKFMVRKRLKLRFRLVINNTTPMFKAMASHRDTAESLNHNAGDSNNVPLFTKVSDIGFANVAKSVVAKANDIRSKLLQRERRIRVTIASP